MFKSRKNYICALVIACLALSACSSPRNDLSDKSASISQAPSKLSVKNLEPSDGTAFLLIDNQIWLVNSTGTTAACIYRKRDGESIQEITSDGRSIFALIQWNNKKKVISIDRDGSNRRDLKEIQLPKGVNIYTVGLIGANLYLDVAVPVDEQKLSDEERKNIESGKASDIDPFAVYRYALFKQPLLSDKSEWQTVYDYKIPRSDLAKKNIFSLTGQTTDSTAIYGLKWSPSSSSLWRTTSDIKGSAKIATIDNVLFCDVEERERDTLMYSTMAKGFVRVDIKTGKETSLRPLDPKYEIGAFWAKGDYIVLVNDNEMMRQAKYTAPEHRGVYVYDSNMKQLGRVQTDGNTPFLQVAAKTKDAIILRENKLSQGSNAAPKLFAIYLKDFANQQPIPLNPVKLVDYTK